ncbi:diacylglycerol/lipid kinase family protein [Robiginitomaculum antarcticum]|uniref:diacylglycerol/lipid kinase family protein n=1 Tax=Robiginitomaculum antarcticum TaxID=437507 RepID=UPI0003761880|nr:diacylglycerol kinase family protein [Robiginitomaculum antarcticum]
MSNSKPHKTLSADSAIGVIINAAGGSATDISDELEAILNSKGYSNIAMHYCEPEELGAAFDSIKKDNTDLLIVFGGDGTCKSGAIKARDIGIPLVALPGGTMNILPKALYTTVEWKDALELALAQEKPRWLPAGRVNDHVFFVGLIIGDPIKMADVRENLRDGEVVDAVKQVPDVIEAVTSGKTFFYTVDGTSYERGANTLMLTCPSMSEGAAAPDAFELASVPQMSIASIIGIGAKTLLKGWRESEHVRVGSVKTVKISGQGHFNILLDGEAEEVDCHIDISLEPKGVLVLAPDM